MIKITKKGNNNSFFDLLDLITKIISIMYPLMAVFGYINNDRFFPTK